MGGTSANEVVFGIEAWPPDPHLQVLVFWAQFACRFKLGIAYTPPELFPPPLYTALKSSSQGPVIRKYGMPMNFIEKSAEVFSQFILY